MSDRTKIEWTDATWNPLIGCTRVSAGCDHCYAIRVAHRFAAKPGSPFFLTTDNRGDEGKPDWTGTVNLNRGVLDRPLRWTRPRRIFVNSLSDLFHDDVPGTYIARVFAVMAAAPQHTFQVLTKRHARMRSLLTNSQFPRMVEQALVGPNWRHLDAGWWPLPNVWLGVSVENQQWADIRIPALIGTPAAVRWISAEPLLGPIDLCICDRSPSSDGPDEDCYLHGRPEYGLDWIVAGGESGPGSRPMHPDWARNLRDQANGYPPFLFKQWGDWREPLNTERYTTLKGRAGHPPAFLVARDGTVHCTWEAAGEHAKPMIRVGKKAAGRHLDGQLHDGYPQEVSDAASQR